MEQKEDEQTNTSKQTYSGTFCGQQSVGVILYFFLYPVPTWFWGGSLCRLPSQSQKVFGNKSMKSLKQKRQRDTERGREAENSQEMKSETETAHNMEQRTDRKACLEGRLSSCKHVKVLIRFPISALAHTLRSWLSLNSTRLYAV